MSKVLKVELKMSPMEFGHEFRNFGEDVYRELKEECSVSIQEIDSAHSVFWLREIRPRLLRSTAAKVRKFAEKHRMSGMIEVTEDPEKKEPNQPPEPTAPSGRGSS